MSDSSHLPNLLPDEVLAHYERGLEAERLFKRTNPIELARTQEILSRYLPPPPAVIFDVGGGSGVYATWLMDSTVILLTIQPILLQHFFIILMNSKQR